MTNSVDAVLPAGGRIAGQFAVEAAAEVKALISLGGRTVLERAICALRGSAYVEHIVVVGPERLCGHPAARGADAVLPELGTGPENILSGLEWLRHAGGGRWPERVLVMTTDLPFVTARVVDDYLEACPMGLDLCVPLVARAEFAARFPGAPAKYVKLRDGECTMGCAFVLNPETLTENWRHVENAYAARKSQWRMARLLGLGFILRFATRRLTVAEIESRCAEMLGCVGGAVWGSSPELAFDIDRLVEYRYAVHRLAQGDA
jgi:molybdopterin-guanine dinucleotide biosynthesis protein A